MAFVDYYKKSPLDRLAPDEYRDKPSGVDGWYTSAVLSLTVLLGHTAINYSQSKPRLTGLRRVVIGIPIAVWAGRMFDEFSKNRVREKWAVIRHYVELHPEDFPDYPPRIKVGNVLQPWCPVRPGA